MTDQSTTLIASTTSAVSAGDNTEFLAAGNFLLTASALAGSEEVDVEISADAGNTWTTLYDYDTQLPVKLTSTRPQVHLKGAGARYRVAKDATASACAVNLINY